MAKNELLPFANGEDANVLSTAQWEALTDIVQNGFQSGIARSEQVNRVLAQGAIASYALGQLIVDELSEDATLNPSRLYSNLLKALRHFGIQTGMVVAFSASTTPKSGYLLCNGAEISRSTYADLFAVIGTTYGSGNGSTTFNLPNLTDKFIQGSGTAGTVKSAGLPNITGRIRHMDYRDNNKSDETTGAFNLYSSNVYSGTNGGSTLMFGNISDFNASRESSIYGKSNTVQPPALTMRMYIKY